MYFTTGYKNCLQTIILLSSCYSSKRPKSFLALKEQYQGFISRVQPHIPSSKSTGIELVTDLDKIHDLHNCFNNPLKNEGIDQLINTSDSPRENEIKRSAWLEDHLCRLGKIEPEIAQLFKLAVNLLFCGESRWAAGGTTSEAIGVVWSNPQKTWQEHDYYEFFMHELTHTLMFLDELRFHHYLDIETIHLKDNFALSAILKASRPMDRVIHSILVATEVLCLRKKLSTSNKETGCIHPATDSLVESAQQSIDSVLSHPRLELILTSRAIDLVLMCKETISMFDTCEVSC